VETRPELKGINWTPFSAYSFENGRSFLLFKLGLDVRPFFFVG